MSGYASSSMVNQHIAFLQGEGIYIRSLELIVGMVLRDGISIADYKGFLYNDRRFECFFGYYSLNNIPIHSKLYIWSDEFGNSEAYIGSANYTQNAFLRRSNDEILSPCDPRTAMLYYESISNHVIDCCNPDVQNLFAITETRRMIEDARRVQRSSRIVDNNGIGTTITLPLLTRNGEIHPRSGLNWGQRPGRESNQAYIPIPMTYQLNNFFPNVGEVFNVITDDDILLVCCRAQGDHGKAIQTTQNNSEMGIYFRDRIGVPRGDFVTKEDLLNYGRIDVDITKLDESTFYMNFGWN
ncbi:restriction endonuclease PLD domain-containing protein [Enterococcus hirae]|uniref:restriction endonuclease PLD domain-containing protein n=1 Tax=Enterococcus hirae TaxID=1354 RepID=UPI0023AAF401|nr:restriction endonuclease PLD domain-containing protein [Enterococcus hirae]